MRVFIAVNLPAVAQKELKWLQDGLVKKHWPVRWERPGKIHLTLAFLAELKNSKTEKLKNVLDRVSWGIKPFAVSFKGLGAFPDFVKPRVVWVGLKGDLKGLSALQKGIEKELKMAKIWFDKKPFVPHLTIGRVKKGISKGALADLGKKIAKLRKIDFQSKILVDSVEIMKSELRPTGSVYTKLAEIKFGNGDF